MNTTKSIRYNKISYCLQYTHESSYIQQKNTRKRGGTLYDDVSVAYQTLRRVAFAHIVETDETAQQTLEDEAASLKKTISDTCSAYETLLTTDESKNNFQNFKSEYTDHLASDQYFSICFCCIYRLEVGMQQRTDSIVKYINENILPDYEGFVGAGRPFYQSVI